MKRITSRNRASFFGRVSELNKYSPALNPNPEETVLTVEIPCSENDDKWNMSDDELGELCSKELQRFGILKTPVTGTKVLASTKSGMFIQSMSWAGASASTRSISA